MRRSPAPRSITCRRVPAAEALGFGLVNEVVPQAGLLGSLAGIPPLAGFMGKLLIFIFAFKAGLYGLLTAAVVGVVISIYYYFGWIRAAFSNARVPSSTSGTPWRRASA